MDNIISNKPIAEEVLLNTIKDTFTSTGDYATDKNRVESFAKSVGMDEANTKLGVVLATQGNEAFIKKAFEDPRDNTKTLDYAQMRALYG